MSDVSLKEYFEMRLNERDVQYREMFLSRDAAVKLLSEERAKTSETARWSFDKILMAVGVLLSVLTSVGVAIFVLLHK